MRRTLQTNGVEQKQEQEQREQQIERRAVRVRSLFDFFFEATVTSHNALFHWRSGLCFCGCVNFFCHIVLVACFIAVVIVA